MKIIAKREAILSPLQAVIGVVERRQTMPILANVLLSAKGGRLAVTATDLEVELVATSEVDVQRNGEVTVPGRKLLDICRALPEGAEITLTLDGERMSVRARKSRFTLSTLPASEFPTVEEINGQQSLKVPQKDFKRLLEKTHFSMAQQDVRYYLNGLLLETSAKSLRSVATDGHRLALCDVELPEGAKSGQQVIVPRKGVLELQRILGHEEQILDLAIGINHIRVQIGDIRFTSKLIDGRFPEYSRVIPNDPPRVVTAVRDDLRLALQRAAILSNEKYRGIRFAVKPNLLTIQSHNPEQEEAEEEVEVTYEGEELEIDLEKPREDSSLPSTPQQLEPLEGARGKNRVLPPPFDVEHMAELLQGPHGQKRKGVVGTELLKRYEKILVRQAGHNRFRIRSAENDLHPLAGRDLHQSLPQLRRRKLLQPFIFRGSNARRHFTFSSRVPSLVPTKSDAMNPDTIKR